MGSNHITHEQLARSMEIAADAADAVGHSLVAAASAPRAADYVWPRCRDCGGEVPAADVGFRPRCKPCHRKRDEHLRMVRMREPLERAQGRIENDCFDEREFQRRHVELNAAIVAELGE